MNISIDIFKVSLANQTSLMMLVKLARRVEVDVDNPLIVPLKII